MESSGMSEAPPLWYIGHHDTGRVDPVSEHVLHRAQDANVCPSKILLKANGLIWERIYSMTCSRVP